MPSAAKHREPRGTAGMGWGGGRTLAPSPNIHTSCPQELGAAWRGGGGGEQSACQGLETLTNGQGSLALLHPVMAAVCSREQNHTSGRDGFVKQMPKGSPASEAGRRIEAQKRANCSILFVISHCIIYNMIAVLY